VDYEAIKHENRRLKEDLDDISAELEEMAKLKKIVEKNLEEALTTIVQEREQKHALKKELDQRLKTDSFYALQSLVNFGLADGRRNHDDSDDSPVLKRIENDFSSGDGTLVTSPSPNLTVPETHSVVGDLFSEIHVTEIRKLEKLLEDVEIQKSKLQTVLDEVRERLQVAEEELAMKDATIEQLKIQLSNSIVPLPVEENLQEQIDVIRCETEINIKGGTSSEEILRLQNSIAEQEERIRQLTADLTVMTQLAIESQGSLSSTQDSLIQITEDVASLYHLVCEVNGETPNRLTLEHVRGRLRRSGKKPKATASSNTLAEEQSKVSTMNLSDTVETGRDLRQSDHEQSPEKDKDVDVVRNDPIACCQLVETISDQIRFLRSAVERCVELSRQRQNESGGTSEETADMAEQIVKLKAMLSAKREQVRSA